MEELVEPVQKLTEAQTMTFALIAMKLRALSIDAQLLRCEPGPIVSTYFLRLGASVPIAKILKAEEDIALAVDAPSVLITRQGGQIAIAIPNKTAETVSFDLCLHSLLLDKTKALPIMLGVNPRGKPEALDLFECPHLLIAGATGAGKSVFLASIIAGLATAKAAHKLKFILCDTKQLELPLYKALPHVVSSADSLEQVRATIDRLTDIVRQRTNQMKGIARNIVEFNKVTGKALPFYVLIIDELADIIMLDRDEAREYGRGYDKFETKFQQLLQICRASGIHVIAATQRPSVDIVTGAIKANLPTRIALRLPSGHDSRTILNEYGAESLLGKGDMLIESPIFGQISRFHGPYISLEAIANVLINSDRIQQQYSIMRGVEE